MPCCAIKARLRPHWASEPFLGLALGILETKLQLPSCLTAHNCETTTPSTPCCRTPAWFRPHQVLRPGFGPSHSALQHPWELNYDSQHPLLPLPGHKLQLPAPPAATSPKPQPPAAFAAGLPHPLPSQHASQPLHRCQTTTPSTPCSPPATQLQLPACPAATPAMGGGRGVRVPQILGRGLASPGARFGVGVPHCPLADFGGDLLAIFGVVQHRPRGDFGGGPSAILGVGPLAILGRGPPPFWGGLGHPSLPWSRF